MMIGPHYTLPNHRTDRTMTFEELVEVVRRTLGFDEEAARLRVERAIRNGIVVEVSYQ